MKSSTYLFYDIETSGLSKCFDQVLQFAAIRTDLDLNELSRDEIIIKLNPDVIPSPGAMVVHRVPLSVIKQGENECDAMAQIHALLNTPGTISLGYNTLGFDDEFLRFGFYRNLLPPYTHQYANRCGRMDIYPLVLFYCLYKPDVLQWPTRHDKPSLKLEDLNAANHLADGHAHNAMVDVEATVALAKQLKQETKVWDYIAAYFDKQTDLDRMGSLPAPITTGTQDYLYGLMLDGKFGADAAYQCPVLGLGGHQHYKNQTLWLRLDQEKLQQTSPDDVKDTTWVIKKKPGEPPFLLPPHDRFLRLSEARAALVNDNLAYLKANPDILKAITHYYQQDVYPDVAHLDVDAALYQSGFPSRQEEALCQKFHAASSKDKLGYLEQFTHPGLRTRALRVMGRHYQTELPEALAAEFDDYLAMITQGHTEHVRDYRGVVHITPQQALAEADALARAGELDPEQQTLLAEWVAYLEAQSES